MGNQACHSSTILPHSSFRNSNQFRLIYRLYFLYLKEVQSIQESRLDKPAKAALYNGFPKSHGLPVYKCRIASRSRGIVACNESFCFNPSLEMLIINITHTRIKMSIQYMAPLIPMKPGLCYLVIGWLYIPWYWPLEISFDVLQQIPFYVIGNDPDSRRPRKVLRLYERARTLPASLTALKYSVSSRHFISHMQSISRSKNQNQLQWIWMTPARRCKSAATSSMVLQFLQYLRWGSCTSREV
jgi:hypothetical protein